MLIPVAYLASYLLSVLGNSIAGVALPLIVLQVTGSVLGAGTVAAATALPAVLAGLLMGVAIDRINRRTSSVVTDLISAAAIAALPLIDLATGLTLGWFILFGVIGSLGDVPGMTAREALLPAIVRHGRIGAERLIGIREALGAIALVLGPAAAGTLMVLFDGSTVLWVTAATSLAAALITLLIPHRVGAVTTGDGVPARRTAGTWSQLREGWRVLFGSGFLLVTTALSVVSVIVLAALQGLLLPVYFSIEQQPEMLGFVLTALAVGMLVGSGIYAVAGARGRRRGWFLAGLVGTTIGFGLVGSLASVWIVFAGAFVVGLSSGLFGSLIGVLMIERIPEQMRGRILGTQNAIMTAAPALGIIVAAVITEYAGMRWAAAALVAVWLVALVLGLTARSLRTLEAGEGPEGETTAVGSA
ncbi:MFS transporter [Microbacterium sp. TNHR37B]|uniref:MFS transporter n=1 Tax=Microbacterium sp. TNHR37B TaxID=1775956 RepID=UPI0007B2B238|nr:MFS transporter [Microbacterium sp. TNHR37B]KZE89882.1 putative multidrug-efflux transporter [Microbacterium sp. TNHR37B]